MNKLDIEKILNYKKGGMLEKIFNAQEEKLARISKEDKEFLHKQGINLIEKDIEFQNAVKNIPNAFNETRKNIIETFNEYNEALNYRSSYFNEKYYKKGLSDGIKIIIEAIND